MAELNDDALLERPVGDRRRPTEDKCAFQLCASCMTVHRVVEDDDGQAYLQCLKLGLVSISVTEH